MKKHVFFEKKTTLIMLVIMIFTAITRLAALGSMPDGVNVDEAYGAYNAWALMTEGIDSRGYNFPVYFVAWGSGMNVMYSYLAIPFFRIFGASIWVYRLPQAIIGICGVYALYVLGREFFDEKTGCLLAFVLAVNPWHFKNMRFGLESNLAPGMLLLAVCFLVLGLRKKHGYLVPSALFFGFTLYCYALSWIVVPLVLVLLMVLFWKQIPRKPITILSVLLLLVMALPLLLFVAVNFGFLEEIRTPLFSVPKLPGFRSDELGSLHVLKNILQTVGLLLVPYDGLTTGLYHLFTAPFVCFGVIYHVISLVKNYKNGENPIEYVMLVWFISASAMCLLHDEMNEVHANLLHIPIIFYSAYGIWKAGVVLKNKKLLPVCVAALVLSSGFCVQEYVTSEHSYFVGNTAGEAIERAKEIAGTEGTVNIFQYPTIKYSYVLWHEKPSPSDFCENVEYVYEVEEWAEMKAYKNFRYVTSYDELEEGKAYIIRKDMEDTFYNMGYEIEQVNETYSIVM